MRDESDWLDGETVGSGHARGQETCAQRAIMDESELSPLASIPAWLALRLPPATVHRFGLRRGRFWFAFDLPLVYI
jgi:hypothetical protein